MATADESSLNLIRRKNTTMTLNQAFAQQFSKEWISSWNAQDIGKIISHYADEIVLISPVAGKRFAILAYGAVAGLKVPCNVHAVMQNADN